MAKKSTKTYKAVSETGEIVNKKVVTIDAQNQDYKVPDDFNGFVTNLPETGPNSYHKDARLSYSGMKQILETPSTYKWFQDNPTEKVTTDSMNFGSLVHAFVLGTPHEFYQRTWAWNTLEGRSQAVTFVRERLGDEVADSLMVGGKPATAADIQAVMAEHGFISDMAAESWNKAEAIAARVAAHPTCAKLFAKGEAEISFFNGGIRGRADWLRPPVDFRSTIVDLKTFSETPTEEAFGKEVAKYSYYLQAALYADMIAELRGEPEPARFIIVAVSSKAPYEIGVYELDTVAMAYGRDSYQRAIATYEKCMETGEWPGLPEQVQPLALPRWETNAFLQSMAAAQ